MGNTAWDFFAGTLRIKLTRASGFVWFVCLTSFKKS